MNLSEVTEMYRIVDADDNTVDGLENLTLEQAENALTALLNEDVYTQMVE